MAFSGGLAMLATLVVWLMPSILAGGRWQILLRTNRRLSVFKAGTL